MAQTDRSELDASQRRDSQVISRRERLELVGDCNRAQKPQNRRELLQAAIGKLGGSVENLWFSFGDYDAYAVVSLPDNVSAEALQIAGLAGAGFKSLKTTPLLTVDQEMEAAAKAGALRSGAAYKEAHKGLEPK